jgi:nucleotide-binding universal stress UspA family protein
MPLLATPVELSLKNILVATDFSLHSEAALNYVLPLAEKFHSTLHLAYVIRPGLLDQGLGGTSTELDQLRSDAKERLESLATVAGDIPHRVWLAEGEVSKAIRTLANENWIDLIVVGASGKANLDKLFLGSVAEEIFRKATCPVLTVGPRVSVKPSGPALKQILYLTNLTEESHCGLDYAISLASHCMAQLMLLHVVEKDEPYPPDQDTLRSYRSILHNLLPQGADLPVEPVLRVEVGKNPAARILWVADEIEASLIVMDVRAEEPWAAHLRDRAYAIISFANCPVLTVRTRSIQEEALTE